MKICISSKGNNKDSFLDPRFGRADYFAIVDTDSMEFEIVDNKASKAAGGAGISSAQLMIDKSIDAVITGNVGPNAMSVLSAGDIAIYRGIKDTVEKNANKFKNKELEKIDETVESHFGMK